MSDEHGGAHLAVARLHAGVAHGSLAHGLLPAERGRRHVAGAHARAQGERAGLDRRRGAGLVRVRVTFTVRVRVTVRVKG